MCIRDSSKSIRADNGIIIGDDNKSILLGASDDMRIRHTGSHSEITDEGTGDLRLGSSRTVIGNPTFSETCARFVQNGPSELYHDNTLRLKTSSSGVNVTGVLTATTFDGGLPITNGANNRIITATSASAIQGEAGLTFDGTTLLNAGSGFKGITIAPSTNNSATLRLQNSQANYTVSNLSLIHI